jgi:hypothetical protein
MERIDGLQERQDQRRAKIAFVVLGVCLIAGFAPGWVGLQMHNQLLTTLSTILCSVGIIAFFFILVFPFRWSDFWFSHILECLGSIGLLRRFQFGSHAEGTVMLWILLAIPHFYNNYMVGAGSYILNDLSTVAYLSFVYPWIFAALHLHFRNIRKLSDISTLLAAEQAESFRNKIKRIISRFNRFSVIFFIVGFVMYVAVSSFWIDPQDSLLGHIAFYVTTTSEKAGFGIVYPPTVVGYFQGKIVMGIVYGIFAVVGGLVVTTTLLLLWLTTEEVDMKIDIYNPICLKPAERLVNSFWLLTGAGLLLVPYATAVSANFQSVGLIAVSRWLSYVGWSYIVFFAGLFLFSLTRFYSFVSTAKSKIEVDLKRELKIALGIPIDMRRTKATRAKLKLLDEFKSRPTLATAFQLIQIVAIILLNVLVKFLE